MQKSAEGHHVSMWRVHTRTSEGMDGLGVDARLADVSVGKKARRPAEETIAARHGLRSLSPHAIHQMQADAGQDRLHHDSRWHDKNAPATGCHRQQASERCLTSSVECMAGGRRTHIH